MMMHLVLLSQVVLYSRPPPLEDCALDSGLWLFRCQDIADQKSASNAVVIHVAWKNEVLHESARGSEWPSAARVLKLRTT